MGATTPRIGACAPWCTAEQVLAALPTQLEQNNDTAISAAQSASDVLYILSGRQFTGACGPVWVRPLSRPTDIDSRVFSNQIGGYYASWGTCSGYGLPTVGVASHYLCPKPPEVDLGAYPVIEVLQVLIDGVQIPGPMDPVTGEGGEWYLQDYKMLVRSRPSVGFMPTEQYGWNTCQDLTLPLDQPGTFGVQFKFGQAPPELGLNAAVALGRELYLWMANQPNQLSANTTGVTRQGVTTHMRPIIDYIRQGQTGLPAVDLFVKTYNPSGQTASASVWSPDVGRPRRVPSIN